MSFWRIAWKNIQQRGLASSLTALSMALGVAVMVCVIVIHAVVVRQFSQDALGYNLIVGGKGGKLELVLSTVFHLGQPFYPIPFEDYRQFVDGRYAPYTKLAIPYCLGDSFDPSSDPENPSKIRFRVVATTPDLFDKIEYGREADGTPKRYEFQSGGRNMRSDYAFEAVIGSVVAAQSGLKVGDTINPTHGISGKGEKHQGFVLTGILTPTGTANDRAVFVNIEGFYLLEGHALSHHEIEVEPVVVGAELADSLDLQPESRIAVIKRREAAQDLVTEYQVTGIRQADQSAADRSLITGSEEELATLVLQQEEPIAAPVETPSTPAKLEGGPRGTLPPALLYDQQGKAIDPLPVAQREVTSILVLCSNNLVSGVLNDMINKDASRSTQAVSPTKEVDELLNKIVGPMQTILLVLTILIVVVASISILVSIYNSMNERSQDIAIMRAVGASRWSVMLIILTESVILALAGGALGLLLGHGAIAAASPYIEATTGVQLAYWQFDPWEIAIVPGLVVLAALAGLLPALTAYRADVADSLR